jgi:hypothetical protein
MVEHHFPVSLIEEEEEKECYKSNVYLVQPAPSPYVIIFGFILAVVVCIIVGIYELFRKYYGPQQQLSKKPQQQLSKKPQLTGSSPPVVPPSPM